MHELSVVFNEIQVSSGRNEDRADSAFAQSLIGLVQSLMDKHTRINHCISARQCIFISYITIFVQNKPMKALNYDKSTFIEEYFQVSLLSFLLNFSNYRTLKRAKSTCV